MVSLVHDSGWTRTPSWPGSVQAGDLAILARAWTSQSGVGFLRVMAGAPWQTLGDYGTRTGTTRWQAAAFQWSVQPSSLPVLPRGDGFNNLRLLVFRETRGVGRSRTGAAVVPTLPGGGAFVIGVEPSSVGDLTVLPGSGTVVVGWGDAPAGGTIGNPGWDHSHTRAYELLPPAGPSTPVLLSPGDGDEVANTGDVEFGWQHRPSTPGGRQEAYRLRVSTDAGDRYWNASTGTFSSSLVTNLSTVEGVSIDGSRFAANVVHEWQVQTREGVDGKWSPWSPGAGFAPVSPPSVQVTGPDNTHDDLSPVVEWVSSTPRGAQTAFRVQVAHLGMVVHDSGVQPGGAGTWQVPVLDWANGGQYQALVQVQQSGGSWSPWSTRDFTVSWTTPDVPMVEAWADRRAGVLVEVSAQSGLTVELERVTEQGLWVPVCAPFEATAGPVQVTDVLAPYGQVTAYRASAANVLDGMPLTSGWGLSGPVRSQDRRSYLAAAGDPAGTWVRLLIREDGPHTHVRPVSVAYGLGDDRARVSYGPGRGRAGSMTVHASTQADLAALLTLLESREPLVVRWPAEAQDTGPGFVDAGTLVFAVAGEVEVARLAQIAFQRRTVPVPWVEQPAVFGEGSNVPRLHQVGAGPIVEEGANVGT